MKVSLNSKTIWEVIDNMDKRRSGIKIMISLIGLIKPLIYIMFVAIFFGVIGFLCSIFITIFSAVSLVKFLNLEKISMFSNYSIKTILIITVSIAILRGFFHYAEQYCNHFIAFKLLALIRHKVFYALRRLAPAKLDSKDKGNLISIITTDIELLEVFYAHTISPIIIAFLTCSIMILFISNYSIYAGVLALFAYITVGVVIPIVNGKRGSKFGMEFRNEFGDLNSFVLESLRGLSETIQYGLGEKRKEEIIKKSADLSEKQKKLSIVEEKQRSETTFCILLFSFAMLILTLNLYSKSLISFDGVLISTVSMMSSFGPVVALSSLSNNLHQTLASGERVLSILEEIPVVKEVEKNENVDINFEGASVNDITFGYKNENILKNLTFDIPKNKILGIFGASGSGKSTLLKLLMRFWDINSGEILISEKNIKKIPTDTLRNMESYVTQETHLFQGTIYENILIGNLKATKEEVISASKKASIHEFITNLPKGYETQVGELGETLSGGEKQRIGLARAFLHNSPLILLDEPTSNLDALNEGIILKSLNEFSNEKTVVLVSHRKSTMSIASNVLEIKSHRKS